MSNTSDLWYDWLGLNTWLFKKINSISGEQIYDFLMKVASSFGNKELLPYFLSIIIAYAVISLMWRIFAQKGGNKYYAIAWFNIFLIMAGGLYAGKESVTYIQKHFAFPRPYVALHGKVKQLEKLPADEAYKSFPSIHVAFITIMVIALWPALNENFRWAGIGLICAVSWSRMALGVNYPMDVISGFMIMLIEMLIIRTIYYGLINRIFKTGF
ncbi:MAG: phosphatase PAP2 family protein [Rickettsiales bacterium]